jgi:predicted RNA-binding protein with TRAM domain
MTEGSKKRYRERILGSAPVEVGKEYDIHITERGSRGDGIARIQGFVIFIKGGKGGQNVKVRITSVGDRFSTAELI